MKTSIKVANVHCGKCVNFIHKSLAALTGVFGVQVDSLSGSITIDHTEEVTRQQLVDKLIELGYAERKDE